MNQRILVVEDNPINQKVTVGLLQQAGFETDLAVDGLEAISAFREKSYDLIVMDCQMPRCDGWAATRAIRKLETTAGGDRRTPIIALTAQALTGDRERCLASGMDDYLTKPVDRELFIQAVRFRLGLSAEHQAVHEAKRPAETQAVTAGGEPLLDQRAVDNLKQYGMATLAQIFGLLVTDLPALQERLDAAITAADFAAAAKVAHRIKGGCGTVGVSALAHAMDNLERQARAGDATAVVAGWPENKLLIEKSLKAIRPLAVVSAT